MNWIYPVSIKNVAGEYVVSVRDLPEVCTTGGTLEEALALAEDAISAVVEHRIEKSQPLAAPSPQQAGEYRVPLPTSMAAKASVYVLWR